LSIGWNSKARCLISDSHLAIILAEISVMFQKARVIDKIKL